MNQLQIYKTGDEIAGRYQIQSFIGEGGMQQVYRALDLVLDRPVALKVPKNFSAQKRFNRSAIVSAKINHPNVAKTLDYIETEEALCLIEELIDGRDLKDGLLLQLKAVDPYLTAKIFHYLAKGISASHEAGVIHRDLKPSNIMFSGDFNFSDIKITDFGIAKMAEEEIALAVEGGESSTSASATVMGALPYMAPEMIQDARQAGKPSDIWALGAMMYELISGTKPFGDGLSVVKNILVDPSPPPPPRILSEKVQFKPLANNLYSLIGECLNKEVDKRPTGQELVQRCEELCYPVVHRLTGQCSFLHPQYSRGFIRSESGDTIFFHFDSIYGPRPKLHDKVCFSTFPGSPYPRAHPVVVMKTIDKN